MKLLVGYLCALSAAANVCNFHAPFNALNSRLGRACKTQHGTHPQPEKYRAQLDLYQRKPLCSAPPLLGFASSTQPTVRADALNNYIYFIMSAQRVLFTPQGAWNAPAEAMLYSTLLIPAKPLPQVKNNQPAEGYQCPTCNADAKKCPGDFSAVAVAAQQHQKGIFKWEILD
ncbi:MAG: hypothetical protein RL497_1603 [Pseudomonadota bacterium]